MNDDRIHDVLSDGVPPAPSPTGWATKAARRSTARRATVGVAALLAVAAVPAAFLMNGERPLIATPASPSPSAPADPALASPSATEDVLPPQPGEVVGVVDIYQDAEEELPHLCFGIVRQSFPPQCDGPTLVGDFSWDDIPHAEHGGMRWTDEGYEVIGLLDLSKGDAGTFTLTRPIRQKDRVYDDEPLPDLPQLCEDPWLDADPSKTDNDAAHAFRRVVDDELPTIQVWSNGDKEEEKEEADGFNVLVHGDAEKAFRAIREVWGGGLCVASSDEPTEKERHAAFDRMVDALPPNTMVFGSAGGIERVLELQVVFADDALKSKLKDAAGDDFEVRITEVFTPYQGAPVAMNTPLPAQGDEVVGVVAIYQDADEQRPHLCVGAVLYSSPAQCAGPTLIGDFSWDDVPHTDEGGARSTTQTFEVVGVLDLDAGEDGTFTLTQPIRQKDKVDPEDVPLDLPNLCVDDSFQDPSEGIRDRDPYKGADPDKTDNDAQHAFDRLEGLPIVDVWSNYGDDANTIYPPGAGGRPLLDAWSSGGEGFNVLVQGDPDEAWRTIREVWGGWLCVASSDAPTEKEREAARQRMVDVIPPDVMLGSSAGGFQQPLEMRVVLADDELKAKIREAAGNDFEVRITEVFTPHPHGR
ncbi:hypothetical protein [Tessaracoccus caeni]|uniref:hypothetical protein n=1 Tax=Tessaracoccus caeni TaxID=3031239 RepID=UPI0023DCDB10|nr:hypothetical protein [Tessaracoccus caeni]MDF1490091.1 hypothetical protein [Tessaracoccus caeni]